MLIDCDRCAMQNTHHCHDCVVSVILSPCADDGAIVIDAEEERALRAFAGEGLIPHIRMRRKRESA